MITHQPLPFRFLVGNFLSCMQRELNFVRVREILVMLCKADG